MTKLKGLLVVGLCLASVMAFADHHDSKLSSQKQKVSYSIGIDVGHNIEQSFQQQNITVDPKAFALGVVDVLNKHKPRLSAQEMQHVMTAFQQDMQVKEQQRARKLILANHQAIFTSKSPVVGNKNANVTLVEFFDYQCVHCRHMAPIIAQLKKQDPKLRIVYKEFPIFGQDSVFSSAAALASRHQGKYEAFHNALLSSPKKLDEKEVLSLAKQVGLNVVQLQKDMKSPAVMSEIKANQALAQTLGIVGTPSFIIGDKRLSKKDAYPTFFVPGAVDGSVLKSMIEQVQNHNAKEKFKFPAGQAPQEAPGTWQGV